jgi:hypothetical protein
VVDAEPVEDELSMTGEGLWAWVELNMQAFKSAFVTDIANLIGIDQSSITKVEVTAGETGLLASQTVQVAFVIQRTT